jgi:two-component system chemotaxis response regulator CheB
VAVKRLSKKYLEGHSFFKLHTNEAFILAENGEHSDFLFLINFSKDDVSKLSFLQNVQSIKLIGSQIALELLMKSFPDLRVARAIHPKNLVEIKVKDDLKSLSFRETIERVGNTNLAELPSKEKKKIFIVDDSRSVRKILRTIIESSDELEVCGEAEHPYEAMEKLKEVSPDLVTLDIHMPKMNGVEFLKGYLVPHKIPAIMISSISMEESGLIMDALTSGALSYIEKPTIEALKNLKQNIITKLEAFASGKSKRFSNIPVYSVNSNFKDTKGMILIGSSTGGTVALQQILKAFPREFPPVLIVQHIPAVFSLAFAERLNSLFPFKVKEAEHHELVNPSTVYIAPGGKQMKLLKRGDDYRIEINDDSPVNRFQPSVDYFFNSVIRTKPDIPMIGLILTGMGKDGAHGLLELKKLGVHTMVQDEESSVVYGMPKAAKELGASLEEVSLEVVPKRLIEAYNKLVYKKVG